MKFLHNRIMQSENSVFNTKYQVVLGFGDNCEDDNGTNPRHLHSNMIVFQKYFIKKKIKNIFFDKFLNRGMCVCISVCILRVKI